MTVSQVTITTPNQSAPEGHEAAMIAKVDAANQTPTPEVPQIPQRPEGVPEKFWDAEKGVVNTEALLKSYTELEKTRGKPAEPQQTQAQATPDADPNDQAAAAAEQAGLKLSELETQWRADGKLSEENMAKLAKAGFSEQDVATYIAGRQALMAQYDNEVMAATPGGSEKYGEMVEWAKANLTDADIKAYNDAVSSGNAAQAKLAVAGLGAKFMAAVGNEPDLSAGRTNTSPTDVYESIAQMKADMADPRYEKDPAFRAKVQAKLGRSDIL